MIDQSRKNKIVSPGDCQIESIVLTSYNGFKADIIQHVSETVINESINYSCLSGYLHIVDNLNLFRNVPLIGNEYVTISFSTPSRKEKIIKTFFCYKVDGRVESNTNKGMVSYRLHFVSQEYVTSTKKKISVSLKDKKYSEMVGEIFYNYLNTNKKLITQPTLEKRNLIIPYMSPFSAINLIALKSLSADTKDMSYMFYEDLDGFYFCNINYFAKNMNPVVEYSWFVPNMSEDRDAMNLKNIEKEFYRIESYDVVAANNTINNINNGLFASTMLMHDSTFKTIDSVEFSYNPDFYGLNTLTGIGTLPQKNDLFSGFNLAHYRLYPRQSYAFDGVEDDEEYDKTILKRNAHIKQMENNRLSVLVAGDSDRRVGELVSVNIPSAQPRIESNEDYDPYLSGKYIITQISHMISPRYYKMRLELERDSMTLAYPEEKTLETKQ